MSRKMRPTDNPEVREKQIISMAIDLAEKQIREGTASSQVITHFLKLGSTREQYEVEKLKKENALLEAKKVSIQSQDDMKQMYEEAIKAMRTYSGNGDEDEYDDY